MAQPSLSARMIRRTTNNQYGMIVHGIHSAAAARTAREVSGRLEVNAQHIHLYPHVSRSVELEDADRALTGAHAIEPHFPELVARELIERPEELIEIAAEVPNLGIYSLEPPDLSPESTRGRLCRSPHGFAARATPCYRGIPGS